MIGASESRSGPAGRSCTWAGHFSPASGACNRDPSGNCRISGPPSTYSREIPAECSRQSKVSSQVRETVCSGPAATANLGCKAAATTSISTAPSLLKARVVLFHVTPSIGHMRAAAEQTIDTFG